MKRMLAMLACAASLTTWATAEYYAIDGSTLTITVPQNITENFDTSFLATVTDNAVTDIVKEGDGTLVMNSNISAYAGTVHVNHGIWVLVDANGLGSSTGGGVFVASGATLENRAASSVNLDTKPISFEGNGFNGMGALHVNATASQTGQTWGRAMTMTGDAFVNASHDNYINFYPENQSYLNMGGHTLYLNSGMRNATLPYYVVLYYVRMNSPGNIVVTNNTWLFIQSVCWWNGTSANRIAFRDSSAFNTGNGGIRGDYKWTLEWDSTGTNLWYNIANPAYYPDSEHFRNRWRGPVELNKTIHVSVENGNSYGGIGLDGPVSGIGGIDVFGIPSRQGFLALTNAANTFTGGVKVRDVLFNIGDGAVPVSGGSVEATDSTLVFAPSASFFHNLPTGIVTATAVGSVVSNGVGRWTHLVKEGNGPLDYASGIGSKTLEIRAGTVNLPAAQMQPWMAGLAEGVGYYTSAADSIDPTTGETIRGSLTDFNDSYAYRQRIVTYPTHLYSNAWVAERRRQSWDATESTKRYLITYSGYIWNRTSSPVTWTFAGDITTFLLLKIDGNVVFNMPNTQTAGRGTVTLEPGPHAIYIANECKINDGGVNGSATNMTWNNLGVRYDPQGRDSTNGADYQVLEDPGDGSLLTWCLPGETAEWPVDTAYLDRKVVVADPAGAKGRVSSVPVFENIVAASGTGMDFAGGSYAVSDLDGFPALTSCTGFSVTNRWTISAAQAVAGHALTGAPVAFGADTELVVVDDRQKHGAFEVEIVSSTATITGNLSIKDADTYRRFRVVVNGDKVLLRCLPKGVGVSFR